MNHNKEKEKGTRYVVDGRPLVLKDVEADAAVVVHVGMEHGRHEADLGSLVRILLRELELQPECAPLPRGIVRPAHFDGVGNRGGEHNNVEPVNSKRDVFPIGLMEV